MLWDIIRDWFVQYIWGGTTSIGDSFNGTMGPLWAVTDNGTEDMSTIFTDTPFVKVLEGHYLDVLGGSIAGNEYGYFYLSLGDWLSTTSTIIVLILMCVFLFMCVRYLFRLTSGLIRG